MAETLATLVKVTEHKVEETQKALAFAEKAIIHVDKEMLDLRRQVDAGQAGVVADSSPQGYRMAGLFMERVKRETERLKQKRAALVEEMERVRTVLAAQYAEQKRYETLLERERLKVKKRRESKQQAALDDTAGVLAERRRRGE